MLQLKKFLRTPKGYLLIALAVLFAITAPHQGLQAVMVMLVAVGMATASDALLTYLERGVRVVPSSALLTGMIVGLIISPQEPALVVVTVSFMAIVAKHVLRTPRGHIFNPAALALAVASPLFGSGEGWWGAASGLPVYALAPLLLAGYLVADRVNKMPSVLAFLGVYFTCFTLTALGTNMDAIRVAEIYRDPFLNSALFFAFFMLTDPPTTPARPQDQVVFGAGVALIAAAVELVLGTETFLLIGLLIGNACWAWRRLALTRLAAGSHTEVDERESTGMSAVRFRGQTGQRPAR
jgi:Na+-translocating ferredoxin:NAD+ oxidoreductase RnfD subunit